MIKLLTVIGARPQIIKASALSRAIHAHFADQITEVLVHTGQHYDENMSAVFFDELAIPQPQHNLRVGSGSHGQQTASMIAGIEGVLETEKPDYVVIYGDTNSTLAGAIAAAKLNLPIIHIEAGLRSFNKQMPEEINRIMADHVSTYLFAPTQAAIDNLKKEGFSTTNKPPFSIDSPAVCQPGDVMYDNSLHFGAVAASRTDILSRLQLQKDGYVLVTLHRNGNTDDATRLNAIFGALLTIATDHAVKLVMPLHPRTAKQMQTLLTPALHEAIQASTNLLLFPPVSFLEMTALEQHTKLVITDSGGVQKEAYFFGKPCLILRAETEWVEIIEQNAAILCDADPARISDGYAHFDTQPARAFLPIYGDGNAARNLLHIVCQNHVAVVSQ